MAYDTRTTPAHDAPQQAPPDPRRWSALAVVLVAGFMDLLDSTIVNVAVPSIQRDLKAGYAQVEWMISGYVLAFAAVLITAGRLGDIHGRRRMVLIGLAGFTLASALSGLSTNPDMLIGARFLQGGMAGIMVPQLLAIVRTAFPPGERARAVGLYGAVGGSATVCGQLLGGLLTQWNLFGLEWRTIFLVNLPVGLAATIAAWFVLRESRSPAPTRLDPWGVVLSITAVFLLIYPLTEGRRLGWPAWIFAMLAGSVLVFAVFLAHQRRLPARGGVPLVELSLFRSRAFAVGLFAWLLFWLALGGFFLAWTLYMQAGLGWSPMHAGFTSAVVAVGAGLGAATSAERLVPRFGRRVLVAGALINAAGFGVYAWIAWYYGTAVSSWQMAAPLALSGLGLGLVVAPVIDLLLGQVPAGVAGSASGLLNTAQQLGMAIGVAVSGVVFFTLLDHRHSSSSSFALVLGYTAALLLVVGVSFLALPKNTNE
ncbi:MFS transporter [Nocardia sp. NPDC088792]|uniref:MFS transporter n=1 Tax=Nocardia sp. NPDC088792 TaxID=3364332 RepID=UPI003808A5E2